MNAITRLSHSLREGVSRHRGRLAGTGVALALAGTMVVGIQAPANAWQWGPMGGRPGGVLVSRVDVSFQQGWNRDGTPFIWPGFVSAPGMVVGRSPATRGMQRVKLLWQLERYVYGQWVPRVTHRDSILLPPGVNQARFPQIPQQHVTSGPGYYRVTHMFIWYEAETASGQTLGYAHVFPHVAGDHYCTSQFRRCVSSPGYVTVGNPQIGRW